MGRADVRVVNGTLVLDQEDRVRAQRRLKNMGLTATITLPALNGISISGVAESEVTGVDADEFSATLSGVGELDITGDCNSLTARVSGVGELDASDFKCENVDVSVSGVGEAKVYASRSADASVSGIGEIEIYGSALSGSTRTPASSPASPSDRP